MRDWEEADNKKLPFFSEDPKLCRRTTDTFVRPLLFSFARDVHVCSSCSLACVLLERPLERLSSVGHSLITFPKRQNQLANKSWKKSGEMGQKEAKKIVFDLLI